MASKKKNGVVGLDRQNMVRYGYGNIPDELKVFLKKQCQIGNLQFFCGEILLRKEGGLIFSDVIFYEIKQDAYGDQVFRNKFWMFYDKMTMTFFGEHIFLGFTPCVSNVIIENTILSADELKDMQEDLDNIEEPPVEMKPEKKLSKRQDPFGRDKAEGEPGVQK